MIVWSISPKKFTAYKTSLLSLARPRLFYEYAVTVSLIIFTFVAETELATLHETKDSNIFRLGIIYLVCTLNFRKS